MTEFERHAGPKICEHESAKGKRADSAVDLMMAVLIGVIGALAVVHWWAS